MRRFHIRPNAAQINFTRDSCRFARLKYPNNLGQDRKNFEVRYSGIEVIYFLTFDALSGWKLSSRVTLQAWPLGLDVVLNLDNFSKVKIPTE